jgi:alanine dehydrogenase
LAGLNLVKREVDFLLGTDEFIHHERRVALVPRQLERLRTDLAACGIDVRLSVVRGAGDRAVGPAGGPYDDRQYEAVGARVVTPEEAAGLGGIDVFHALKEPTAYEAEFSGPFLRVGAVHLASKPPGLCQLFAAGKFAAIIDGATVGNCSYRMHGGDRTPIVGSMSRFAGSLAGRKVVEGLDRSGIKKGKIIVVGGGIAGWSALLELQGRAEPLVVVEPWEPTRKHLRSALPAAGFGSAQVVSEFTEEIIEDAVGLVFAHRSGAKKAEKVCDYERHIRRMRKGGAIADIAIDQGGSIDHDGYSEEDDALASRDKYRALLSPDFFYYAETNMPREEPFEASRMHGDSSLPYITALLGLCAHLGDAAKVVEYLLQKEVRVFRGEEPVGDRTLLDCVAQDLRNGTQLAMVNGRVTAVDPDIAADTQLMEWIEGCSQVG